MAAAWLRNALSLEGFQEGFVKSGTLSAACLPSRPLSHALRSPCVRDWGQNVLYCCNHGDEAPAADGASSSRVVLFLFLTTTQVLAGALSALWIMTALSAAIGTAAPALVRSGLRAPGSLPSTRPRAADLAAADTPRGHCAVLLLRRAHAVRRYTRVGRRGGARGG